MLCTEVLVMSSNVPLLVRLERVKISPCFLRRNGPGRANAQLVSAPNAISRYRFTFRVLGIHLPKRAGSGAKL